MTIVELLLGAANLIGNLAQTATNGASNLGTIDFTRGGFGGRNHFGGGGYGGGHSGSGNFGGGHGGRPGNGGGPSPGQSTGDPNNPPQMPNTGVTRSYYWDISRGVLAPDGVQKQGIYINGQFPGPPIEANWGDTFQIMVHNNITGPEEGTSIHWHGLLQKETPWMDGIPSTSQCPIAPGSTFTYTFRADSCGTSWYHAHYSAQYIDGVFGPMIIYCPSHVDYDIDVGPVLISDYYHTSYYPLLEQTLGQRFTPNSDNNLINGKMFFDCANANGLPCTPGAGVSKFSFQSGKRHRLRLINSGAEGLQRFTIDNHKMWIIANDFVPIQPIEVDQVTLSVGQRTDIVVEATGSPDGVYWMRSTISASCSFTSQPYAMAAIYYENADTSATPQSTATPVDDSLCQDLPLNVTIPFYPQTPPAQPAVETRIDMEFGPNATGHMVWMMNGVSFRADYNNPILLLANQGNTSYPNHPEWNVYNYNQTMSVRFVLSSIVPLSHPMHVHGHDFWVLAEGQGQWDGTVVRPENPQRRDVHLMNKGDPTRGLAGAWYLVIEFLLDNPGVWPLHCHTAWHLSGGMYINILERPDLILNDMQIPDIMAQTCREWWAYSGSNVVDQIDAGV